MNRSEHKPSRIRLALVAVIGASIVTVAGVAHLLVSMQKLLLHRLRVLAL